MTSEEIITWLRTPDGEAWSRQRIKLARKLGAEVVEDELYPFLNSGPVDYGDDEEYDRVLGFFSLKEPDPEECS
jgi:hypothetical protein